MTTHSSILSWRIPWTKELGEGYCPWNCKKLITIEQLTLLLFLSSVQSLSHVRLFVTPWAAASQASLSLTNSWSLLKLTFLSNYIYLEALKNQNTA